MRVKYSMGTVLAFSSRLRESIEFFALYYLRLCISNFKVGNFKVHGKLKRGEWKLWKIQRFFCTSDRALRFLLSGNVARTRSQGSFPPYRQGGGRSLGTFPFLPEVKAVTLRFRNP